MVCQLTVEWSSKELTLRDDILYMHAYHSATFSTCNRNRVETEKLERSQEKEGKREREREGENEERMV